VNFQIFIISFTCLILGLLIGKYSAQKKINNLKNLAFRDGITGLFNARMLENYLSSTSFTKKYPRIGFIIIDLDDFRKINMHYGFRKGDEILKKFSESILASLENNSLAFRYKHGDEFVIVIPNGNIESINHYISQLVKISASIKFSFGYSFLSNSKNVFEEEISTAESMLFQMKKTKNNRNELL
jgi:diguanylate cyclase (GGDEF)-like protein